MPQCVILLSAEDDLDQIWEFIARDNPQNADRFVDLIYDFCNDTLATQPMMGLSRSVIEPELRSFAFRNYIIFYRPIEDGVEIFHVYESHRDIDALFH